MERQYEGFALNPNSLGPESLLTGLPAIAATDLVTECRSSGRRVQAELQ